MTHSDAIEILRRPAARSSGEELEVASWLSSSKQDAVTRGDEPGAKRFWCLEQVLKAQQLYANVFQLLKSAEYYNAWCELERLELTLQFLAPHLDGPGAEFEIDFIDAYRRKWQKLFPYKIFMSPEIIQHEKICSVCRQVVSIRKSCGHRVGEIYQGEMCVRIVSKPEYIGLAMVTDPVQKYSVPFMIDPETGASNDRYDYRLVEYPIRRLESPYHEWECVFTRRRHPHARFSFVGRNDKCPCESGRKYKKCCLLESGVLRPHVEYTFHVPPPAELLGIEYRD